MLNLEWFNKEVAPELNKYTLIIFGILLGCAFTKQKVDYRERLIGTWVGKIDSVTTELNFTRSSGTMTYSTSKIKYNFTYRFLNDTTIKIKRDQHISNHILKFRAGNKLRLLVPWHEPLNETADLINLVEFLKRKQNRL